MYLHANYIIHRDIKPANCLIHRLKEDDAYALLSDFGLAVRISPNELVKERVGTIGYMAPEVDL